MQIQMIFERGSAYVPAVCSTSDINRTDVTIPRSVLEAHVRDNGLPVIEAMPTLLGRITSGWHYVNSDGERVDSYSPGNTLHFTLHEEANMTMNTLDKDNPKKSTQKNKGVENNGSKRKRTVNR